MLVIAAGQDPLLEPEWLGVVNNLVYAPYGANKTLAGTILSSPRNTWARNKSLSFATTLLSQRAVLNTQTTQPTPGEPDAGFYSLNSQPAEVLSTPVALVSPGRGAEATSRLLSAPLTASYGADVREPTQGLVQAQLPSPLDTGTLPAVQAAANSSAAVALTASVAALEHLSFSPAATARTALWVGNLAPASSSVR